MRTDLLTVVLIVAGASVSFAQTPNAADGPWSGQMQCVLSVRAPNYQDDQTHTWRIIPGPPFLNGVFRQWPAVWSVQGGGNRSLGTGFSETWKITAPDTNAPLAFSVNIVTGQIRIGSQHGLLSINGAVTGTTKNAVGTQPIIGGLQEWPFPIVDDVATATTIGGTRTRTAPNASGWRQPPGVPTTETCSWRFDKTPATDTPESVSSATTAAPASTQTQSLSSAGSAGSIQSVATTTSTTTDTARREERTLSAGTVAALTSLLSTASAGGVTATLTGPAALAAGAQGKFDVRLVGDTGTTATVSVTLAFDSGEGETASGSTAVTSSSPASLSATFTFQSPGTFTVSARGNATKPVYYQVARNAYVTEFYYDESCMCQKSRQVVRTYYVTESRIDSYAFSVQRPVTVTAP